MAIQKQIWVTDIKQKLFPENSFMVRGMNDDAFVENRTVNLQDEGDLPEVEINRTSLPATITGLNDTPHSYNVDEFTSSPSRIQDIEEIETNYNKRQSVLSRHIRVINNKIAQKLLFLWAATASANIIRTNGDNRDALVTGATGTRKKMQLDQWFEAKNILDDMDVPQEGRCVCLPAYMYNDMLKDEKETLMSLEFSGRARIENGQLNKLLGFDIYIRGKKNILSYTNAATPVPRDVDANALTTANGAALFWHEDFVRRALGAVKVYAHEDDPTNYGSIFSAMARAGGKKAYNDGTGVVAVVEAAGA